MRLRLMIILLGIATISRGQSDFDLEQVKFMGLGFITSKSAITSSLGQGKKVETNYDCGFFTNDHADGPFYQLVYNNFSFIGSDKGKFYLQSVSFDKAGKVKINYSGQELSGRTTIPEFIRIMGYSAKEHFENYPNEESLILYSKSNDDGARFIFKAGRLYKFEYWTPC